MKENSTEERNQKVYDLLQSLFSEAEKIKGDFIPPFNQKEIETLFSTHIWGHREIVLTIILARLLDKNFYASKDFYSCNPRSLFEKPIRSVLRARGIPHKKSGPLNVAKNIQKINKDWAVNKRGDGIALIVVSLVKKIEKVSHKALRQFAVAFAKRYLQEARTVEQMRFVPKLNDNPVFLFELCHDLIADVPDGGSIPQVICGLLIELSNRDRNNNVIVTGHKDSVSTTNTTSKKPGDAIEAINAESEIIYEITVKQFHENRLLESYESIKAYEKHEKIRDVIVICRRKDAPAEATDCSPDDFLMSYWQYQDVCYFFVNIDAWLQEKLLLLTPKGRREFYHQLTGYINDPNSSAKVKQYFKKWHTEHQSSN